MDDRRLIFVSGKGGVGKSAVTAALALRAARRGERVLAIGMVDSLGLAAHFGVDALEYEPHQVHTGVDAVAIDRTKALDEYLRLQLHLPKAAPIGQASKVFQVFVDIAPGVREIISMGKPIFETWQGTYDKVIVDAPPLGQLFSYLRAPATIAQTVPTGAVQDQALRMRDTLGDPTTSALVLVTLAEELPVMETAEALDDLAKEPVIDLAALAVNRVLSPLGIAPSVVDDLAPGPQREAANLHENLFADQQPWLAMIPAGPRLPYLFGFLTPGEVAARLVDHWEAAS